MEPVELHIDELVLRPWRLDDAEALHRAFVHPTIQRWVQGLPQPYTPERTRVFVTEVAPGMFADDSGVPLGIFSGDGELLGAAALTDLDLAAGTADVDYWTAASARGRRVAERAMRALLRWAFDELGLKRAGWQADVGNHASRLTGLRLGVQIVGVTAAEGRDVWTGSLTAGDLTAAGTDVDPGVRRHALVFGAAQPTLTTTLPGGAAVVLRAPAEPDVPGIAAACQDPATLRWTTVPDPYTERDAAWFALQHAPAVWARGTAAVFVIAGPDGSYAGSIDLRISPADPAVADVGYLIAPHARGRGYATAALAELSRWGLTALGLQRVEWKAHTDNVASRRVAEKAGFTVEGVLRAGIPHRGERLDCWLGSRLPSDLGADAGQRPADARVAA